MNSAEQSRAEQNADVAQADAYPDYDFEHDGERRSCAQKERAALVHHLVQDSELHGTEGRLVYRFVKRLFDIVFSLFVLVCFCWLYAIIAIVVKSDSPGPAIFKQRRIGRGGKEFTMYKFRSMVVDAEARQADLQSHNMKSGPVFKMIRDPRVTRVGRVLRKYSLDELPQFVNVLRGDISVVGPRPALPREVAAYDDYQRQRLLVPPGVTCYWQTRLNRDFISFDEWVDWDLLYVRNCGVWADFKLIVQTVGVILTAQGN